MNVPTPDNLTELVWLILTIVASLFGGEALKPWRRFIRRNNKPSA